MCLLVCPRRGRVVYVCVVVAAVDPCASHFKVGYGHRGSFIGSFTQE